MSCNLGLSLWVMRLVDWVSINQQKFGAPRCEPWYLIGNLPNFGATKFEVQMMKQTLQKEITKLRQNWRAHNLLKVYLWHDGYIALQGPSCSETVDEQKPKKDDGMLTTLRYELHQLVRRILSIRPSVSILPVLICTHLDIAVDKFSKSCSQRNQFMAMTGTGRRVAWGVSADRDPMG